jgi:hypothetical protein
MRTCELPDIDRLFWEVPVTETKGKALPQPLQDLIIICPIIDIL